MSTMKEVAKKAGVSIATVSAVINENKYVSEELKEKVNSAIQELNYRPNRIAQSLKGKETKLIGITVTEITNPFYPLLIKGVEDKALSSDYNIILSATSDDEEKECKVLESMLAQGVDGVIMATVDNVDSKALKLLEKEKVPMVLINRAPKNFKGSSVCIDSFQVGVLATEHLINLGHRQIAFIGGDRQNTKEREYAFLKTMKAHSLPVPKEWVIDTEYSLEKTTQQIKEMIRSKRLPTAIYVGMDVLAFWAARILLEHGIRIPEDISIIGSDNIPFSEDFRVPLTTVEVHTYEIGQRGFELLLNKITSGRGDVNHKYVLEPELVIRNSTQKLNLNEKGF